MTLKIRILGFLLSATLLSGCNSMDSGAGAAENNLDADASVQAAGADTSKQPVAETPVQPPKPDDYPVEPFPDDSLYQLLVAEVAGYRGHYDTALEKYVEMAEQTRDAGVAARATRLANYLKRSDAALRSAQIWAEADPENLDAHRHAAELLMRSGDLEGAILHMEAVKNLGGLANFDIFAYRAANLLDEEREALLQAIDRMLQRYPDDEQLMFSKAVLLEQKGDAEGSLALADRLLEKEQKVNTIILKVNALKSLHRAEDAIDFLDKSITGMVKSADAKPREETVKRLRLIYARFLFEARHLDRARKQYEIVHQQSPNDGDILFALALIAMEQEKLDAARGYFEQMIRWNRRIGEARYYLGSLAEKAGDIELAIKEYKQVGKGYEFLPAQSRIANLLMEQGRIADMQKHLANMRGENPDRANQLIMVEAEAFVSRGMEAEVFVLLDDVLASDPENIELLYFRAMTGEKFSRLDILERDLKQIIEIDPDNADAMNALGYTLTDQTDRHEEALVLIQRALEIKPDEPAYIDSLGWVNYRLENYPEAIEHLRRALSLFQNDEVAAHLGEALWVSGDQAEAMKVWESALEIAPESKILKEVIDKFTNQ